MKKLLLIAAAIVALSANGLRAQEVDAVTSENDFRARTSIDLSYKPSRRWKISLNEELRMKNSASDFDRIYSTLGVAFKPVRHLEIEGGYTFATIWHDGKKKTDYLPYWDYRHRLFVGAEYVVALGDWRISLRERCQSTFRTDSPKAAEKANPATILRSRLKAKYKFRYIPIEPYAGIEVSNTLNAPTLAGGNYIEKIRYTTGIRYIFDTHSTLELYYRLDDCTNYNIDVKSDGVTVKSIVCEYDTHHIVGIEFAYRF